MSSFFQIEARIPKLDPEWQVLPVFKPKTREDAERLVEKLARAMVPLKEFRVKEIDDEDIPF